MANFRKKRGRKDRHDNRNQKRIQYEKKTFGVPVEKLAASNWETTPVGKKYVQEGSES